MPIELKQGLILKSSDGSYVYNIFSYTPGHDTMILDILDSELNTIATKNHYSVDQFMNQIAAGTIVAYNDNDIIGKSSE